MKTFNITKLLDVDNLQDKLDEQMHGMPWEEELRIRQTLTACLKLMVDIQELEPLEKEKFFRYFDYVFKHLYKCGFLQRKSIKLGKDKETLLISLMV